MAFINSYEDATRAAAYAQLEFANTYHLAFRDLHDIIREHVTGTRGLDFGCGAGRSTRFVGRLGFDMRGIDIAPEMITKARELDPDGVYSVIRDGDLRKLPSGGYDLVLSAFTFDNIPGCANKARLFGELGALLNASGTMINLVSSPEIYLHEWASFSTRDFPENRFARCGDMVRIVTTDFADRRPTEDILCTDACYRLSYARAGLKVVAVHEPLANGREPYAWVTETAIAPWVIYVLKRDSQAQNIEESSSGSER